MKIEIITITQVGELADYASEEGAEWGEASYALCELYYASKELSDEFHNAYQKELKALYDSMILNTEVVTEKEKIVYKERKYRVWK